LSPQSDVPFVPQKQPEQPREPLPPIEDRFKELQALVALLEASLAELRSDQQPGLGHNKGPTFASVEDLSDVDDLIALLKERGPQPPSDPKPLMEQGEKALRVSERIWNAVLTLGGEMAKGAAREIGGQLVKLIGISYLIHDVYRALVDWLSS
jgi:hypothetical protein